MASTETTRRVWALVTREPQLSMPRIAKRLRIGVGTVHRALHILAGAGYISFLPRKERTRQIIVPFIEQRKR